MNISVLNLQKSLKFSNFKEKFAAFSMKITDSKDLVKVNQILPIMQEHFGNSMNLARIRLMAFVLHALCVVQTVSLHKLASAMPTAVERDSNLRRIQRFIAHYALSLDLVARMIFSLLPVKEGVVLSMDRTNWKFGDFNINILMLGITYKGIAFPLMFSLLDKRGNSSWKERKAVMERFIRLFGCDCIDCLVADREFIGKEWIGWLNENRIRYYIRIRQNFWVVKPSSGERIRAWWLFNSLKTGQEKFYYKLFLHKGQYVYLAGSRIKNSKGVPEIQILICFNRPEDGISTYRRRWEIETAFRALKSSGFNIEDTHLRDRERIARLLALVCIALVWAYLVGEHKDLNVKPIRILKHGRRAKSLVKYGLEEISNVLFRQSYTPKFDVFKFLSCT